MLPCILGLAGPTLALDESAFFREADPAGFILFGRNIADPEQVRALTAALRDLAGRDLPILIDQEGGRVARLGPPHWPAFPAAAAFGALYARAPFTGMEAARANAAAIGATLADLGINLDAAPVLDLAVPGAIGDRASAADPLAVAALGRQVLDGLSLAGVAGVVKHMPGHGRAVVDSHLHLPRVDAAAELLNDDIAPFARLAGRAKWGMTAHVVYEAWDAERPATLSPRVIAEVIRGRIGFAGLLLTDDIAMHALEPPAADRGVEALAAGCDLVLLGSGDLADARQLAAALPAAAPGLAERIAGALSLPPRDRLDLDALLAKRDALFAHGTAA